MSPARSMAVAVTAALIILSLTAGATVAATDGPPDVSPALLAAEDLPSTLGPSGVTHDPAFDYDQASFEANGGIDAAAQTWQATEVAPDDPLLVVFDFRFLFPDAASAQAYLDAAEPVLSETITGITLQPDTPPMGEVVRRYAGSMSQQGVTIDIQNILFRVGPVVAKVYVAGFGTTLEDALPVATAAGQRTETWLIAQAVGSPGASMAPATSAVPATSPVPAASGGPGSSAVPAASAGPGSGVLRQWAVAATASSEYGSESWSAAQATGEPDVDTYADDVDAWAPATSDGGLEWLELTYEQAVVPTAVGIVESYGSGAVVRVEGYETDAKAWVELWSGVGPEATGEVVTFSPELALVDFATERIRVTLDTAAVPSWNEIDAVELVGTVP